MVEEKARVVLSKSEFATLAYYQEEYAAHQMTIEAFVAVLLELLSSPEKVSLLNPSVLALIPGSCHKRQKPQTPTPQAPIRNRQTRKIANAKGLNRNTNVT